MVGSEWINSEKKIWKSDNQKRGNAAGAPRAGAAHVGQHRLLWSKAWARLSALQKPHRCIVNHGTMLDDMASTPKDETGRPGSLGRSRTPTTPHPAEPGSARSPPPTSTRQKVDTGPSGSLGRSPTPTAAHPAAEPPAARNPPLASRLAVLYYCFSFGYFVHCWVAAFLLCRAVPVLWPLLLAYVFFALGPRNAAAMDGSWPTPFRRWRMWKLVARYFPAALHTTAALPPTRPYLFGCHPHGLLSFGAWLSFATDALEFERKLPGVDCRLLTLNLNFRAPFLREYLLLHGLGEFGF